MTYHCKALIYGPDDRITAAIASWQLINGNHPFDELQPFLKRYIHSPSLFFEGEEVNNGVLDLEMIERPRDKVVTVWHDFLVHCEQLFMLEYEHIEYNDQSLGKPIQRHSNKNAGMLKLRYSLAVDVQKIPDTERPFLAL